MYAQVFKIKFTMSGVVKPYLNISAVFFVATLIISCGKEEIVPEVFYPRTDHEAYLHSLEQSGILQTAVGATWKDNAYDLLYESIHASLPFKERFFLDPSKPDGISYRFRVMQGQAIKVDINKEVTDSLLLFIDLFRVENDSIGLFYHVASADKVDHVLGFEPRVDAEYILRVQPEILRGGMMDIEITKEPSLDFPVAGASNRDIGSFFGDPRDGGRRKHHGVDIFARRHTPIIAPTDGYVRFSGERGLGGRVVWMRDTKRDQTLYFAHLQDIYVERGDRLLKGDTLGTVGNTGNARTTPPHLHFGIYKSGPKDPYHHIAFTRSSFPIVSGDESLIGSWVRTQRPAALYEGGDLKRRNGQEVPRFQMMRVMAANSSAYRIELPDGHKAYVSLNALESIAEPIRNEQLESYTTLFDRPLTDRIPMADLTNCEELSILGSHDSFWYVSESNGRSGWVSLP